jgi:uncharacterized protein YjaZ
MEPPDALRAFRRSFYGCFHRRSAALFELDRPLHVNLLVFVGTGGPEAFLAAVGGQIHVAIPVTQEPDGRALALAHEFAHAAHHVLAGLPEGWERSIAQTILGEGIAMHASRLLFPGRDVLEYVVDTEDWWRQALQRRREIACGILPFLASSDSDAVERFTIGEGTTGLRREAYAVGWPLVEHLLERGHTLAALARIPPDELPAFVENAIVDMMAEW